MNSYETIKANKENGVLSFSDFTIKTKMVNGKEKKVPHFRTDWSNITFDNCLENVNQNVAVITGKISGVTVIDFDCEESYDQIRKDYGFLDEFKLVKTNNGFHLYGKYNPDLKTGTNVFEKYPKVDIKNDGGCVFAPPTKYTLLDGSVVQYEDKGGAILEFPKEIVELQKSVIKQQKAEVKQKKKEDKQKKDESLTNMEEICKQTIEKGLLDHKCDDYDDWTKVGFALFNSLHNFELFDLFSQRSANYDKDGVVKFWSGIKEKMDDNLTFRSILYWAKEKDEKVYTSLNINEGAVSEQDNELTFLRKSRLFEKTHLKIIYEGLYIHEENNEVKISSEAQIRANYKHIRCGFNSNGHPINFIDRWLVCNNEIRRKNKMGIHMKNCPEDTYNLWTPFSMDLVGDYIEKLDAIELFKKHVSILCNHEEKVCDYVIDWIADMIQNPELKSKMLIFVSKQGAGKNLLLNMIRKMIGNKKVFESTDPARDVWGNFNGKMVDAFLVNLSEISAIDFKNAQGKVKALITDDTITINEKSVKPFKLPSFHHFITFTNEMEAVKPSKDDRRNCLIQCSDELIKVGKTEQQLEVIETYIETFVKTMNDVDSVKTIFEWLKSRPVDDFLGKPFPMTEFHKTQSELSVSPIEAWLRDFIGFHHEEKELTLTSSECYTCFKDWIKCNMPNYECTNIQFSVRLTNFNKTFITTKHTKKGNDKVFNIPELLKLLVLER
jgi:hypothetical protein